MIPKPAPPTPAQTAVDLWATVARLLRRMREAGADDDLTPSQASALGRLGKGGVSTASALATAERVRPQSMAATIEALEAAGFVTRTPDPSDGRRQIIDLTDLGRQRLIGQREAAAEWLEHALSELDPDELTTVASTIAILGRILP